MKYGLLTTGHIKNDANAYLAKVGARRLSEDLALILTDKGFQPVQLSRMHCSGNPQRNLNILMSMASRRLCLKFEVTARRSSCSTTDMGAAIVSPSCSACRRTCSTFGNLA